MTAARMSVDVTQRPTIGLHIPAWKSAPTSMERKSSCSPAATRSAVRPQTTRADGEVSLREALDETVTAVGPNHPDTAWVLENYSEVLRKSGRKAEARNAE